MKLLVLLIVFSIIFLGASSSEATVIPKLKYYTVSGKVISEEDETPLVGVTIRATDQKGAYSNSKGEFSLQLAAGTHHLVLTMVGMEKLIATLNVKSDTSGIVFRMLTNPAILEGVVVIAEDPGMRLMRRAIEKKKEQSNQVNSYKYLLYTKFVVQTDTITAGRTDKPADSTIFSIFESYSVGYFLKPNNYYNKIIQRRQSDNVPPQANFVAFGTNLNIYDDFITILGEEIFTPFHPNAPDFYDFILDTNYFDYENISIRRIIVNTTTDLRRMFSGYVYLNEETLMPTKVELYPNVAVRLPFNTKMKIVQTFHNDTFTFPQWLEITTSSQANIFGLIQPRLDINLVTYATNFEVNVEIDKRLFNSRSVNVAPNADKFDTTFWETNKFVELTKDELDAYYAIRRFREAPDSAEGTNIFTKYLRPFTRQLEKLERRPFTGWEDMLIYNKVKGFNPTISLRDDLWSNYRFGLKLGYGISDKKPNYELLFSTAFDELKQYRMNVTFYNTLKRSDAHHSVRTSTITLNSLLTGFDYGDYYYGKGLEVVLSAGFGQLRFIRRNEFERPTVYKLFFRIEKHTNAKRHSSFSFFQPKNDRINPPIIEGTSNIVGFEANWNFHKARRLSNLGFSIGGEWSSKKYLKSDFDYSKLEYHMNWRQRTFPLARIDAKLSAGYVFGEALPHKFFSIESSSSFISGNTAMRGTDEKEFYGSKFVSLSLEHNWGEIIPGLIRIPNIAEFGLEFVNFVNLSYSGFDSNDIFAHYDGKLFIPNSTAATIDKWYYEIGLGVNRLLIFFRTDITIRLSQVEHPRFFLKFTSANF